VRTATWLEPGRLAVAGGGVSLIDTRSWRVRTLDRKASDLRVAGPVLLASGSDGIAGYDPQGHERFRVLAGQTAWVEQVYAGRAYIRMPGVDILQVVDLASGRTVAQRAQPLPWLLTGPAASWWD
jgi:hypothetical protein